LLFRKDPMARSFVEVLFHYRDHQNYLLHEFVLMPEHFHLLIWPTLSLERSLQLITGGFSYRAKKELGFAGEIWEKSFYDRRVRGAEDYYNFKQYIRRNPVKQGLAAAVADYPYSSARPEFVVEVEGWEAFRHPKSVAPKNRRPKIGGSRSRTQDQSTQDQ
jgi:putative transposase